jgi:signal transduction histidine kinase
MTNILRHAGAKEVFIKLWKHDHQLCLSIEDDGHGFDQAVVENNRSTGLSAMKERTALVGGR